MTDINCQQERPGELHESDIRPEALMLQADVLFREDIARLMEGESDFVRVPCPACGSTSTSWVFEKLKQQFESCRACETVFANPRPTPEQLAIHYQTARYYGYWNEVIFPASENARREKIFRPRVQRMIELLERSRAHPQVMLEVGAGFGTFCEEVAKLNHFRRIIAVEPTPSLAESCRKRGLDVIGKPVEEIDDLPFNVDLIASFEVIEHLFSPRDFVSHCTRLLVEGGVLLLTCPNVKGFDISLLGPISNSVEPEHLNYFHPASLSQLVVEHGFEILEVSTPGRLDAELVRKKALGNEISLLGQPFLRRVLLEDWDRLGGPFQEFLAANKLSSHMWLAARKLAS